MLPIPGQMLVAAAMALLFRAHLPLSLACTWITNPLTYAPIYYFTYRVGLHITGQPEMHHHTFEITAFYENFYALLIPLLAGSITTGLIFGSFGYAAVRFYWRIAVLKNWDKRRLRNRHLRNRFRKRKAEKRP